MKFPPGDFRRAVPLLLLAGALIMLLLGQTVLAPHLDGIRFFYYWLICSLLTGLAALTALADMFRLRNRLREEQRKLIETTLNEVKSESEKFKKTPTEK